MLNLFERSASVGQEGEVVWVSRSPSGRGVRVEDCISAVFTFIRFIYV